MKIKNLSFVLWGVMLVFLSSIAFAQTYTTYDKISEGDTKFYSPGGKDFTISAVYIGGSPIKAKLSVNEELTSLLAENSSYKLADGSIIMVKQLTESDLVFYLSPAETTTTSSVDTSSLDTVNDILEEGQTKLYTLNGIYYEITPVYIAPSNVKIKVNGQVSDLLVEGEVFTFYNEAKLLVIDIISATTTGAVDKVEFKLKAGTVSATEVSVMGPIPNFDLSKFPAAFVSGDTFNGVIVIGDGASASDVIAATDLSVSIKSSYGVEAMVKMASEIGDISTLNIISIGNPCNNKMSSRIMGNPLSCSSGLVNGEGIIKAYTENGFVHILVSGYSDDDVRKAVRVLMKPAGYGLKGTSAVITGTYSNPVVGTSTAPVVVCSSTNVLTEGETKIYTVNGNEYEITAMNISSDTARLGINDEFIQPEIGGTTLIQGIKVTNNKIVASAAGDRIYFCINGAAAPESTVTGGVVPTVTETTAISEPTATAISEPTKIVSQPTTTAGQPATTAGACNGCVRDSTCLPFGTRLVDENLAKYCDITKGFVVQKDKGEMCQNNYECQTNQCSDGVCDSISEELKETRGMLQKILDWLKGLFGKKE